MKRKDWEKKYQEAMKNEFNMENDIDEEKYDDNFEEKVYDIISVYTEEVLNEKDGTEIFDILNDLFNDLFNTTYNLGHLNARAELVQELADKIKEDTDFQ